MMKKTSFTDSDSEFALLWSACSGALITWASIMVGGLAIRIAWVFDSSLEEFISLAIFIPFLITMAILLIYMVKKSGTYPVAGLSLLSIMIIASLTRKGDFLRDDIRIPVILLLMLLVATMVVYQILRPRTGS